MQVFQLIIIRYSKFLITNTLYFKLDVSKLKHNIEKFKSKTRERLQQSL